VGTSSMIPDPDPLRNMY